MTAGVRRGSGLRRRLRRVRGDGALRAVVRCAGRHRDDRVAADGDRAGGAGPARARGCGRRSRSRRSSSTSRPASRSGARRSSRRATRWRRSWAPPCCGGSRSIRGWRGCVTCCCWSGCAALGEHADQRHLRRRGRCARRSLHAHRELPGVLGGVVGRRRDGRPADRAADLRVGVADAAVATPAALAGGGCCWRCALRSGQHDGLSPAVAHARRSN